MQFKHISVLPEKVLDFAPEKTQTILDCTLGGGGHSRDLLEKFPNAKLYGIDRDLKALKAAKDFLKPFEKNITLKQANFSELKYCFIHWMNPLFDYILADIGTSSEQIENPERGFSFNHEGPLDMRMDPDRQHITAAYLVNNSSKYELLKIIQTYGEERYARKIVNNILAEREKKSLKTTKELAEIINQSIPNRYKKQGFNPATLTFQALRIAVNKELNELSDLLEIIPLRLKPDGRFAIISFHSLEDRMIKHKFRKWEKPCTCPKDLPYCICGEKSLGKVLTKRPVCPSEMEVKHNRRCRSAHLRVFSFKKNNL